KFSTLYGVLTQVRSGITGLRSFLFRAQATNTPRCSCGVGRETIEHLVAWCRAPPKPRTWERWAIRTRLDLCLVLQGRKGQARRLARKVLNWLMQSGRLPQYRLTASHKAGPECRELANT